MNPDEKPAGEHPQDREDFSPEYQKKPRGLGLSILLVFSMVYNGFFVLIFFAGFFYPDVFQEILQLYYKQNFISKPIALIINIAAAFIFCISFYGLILLWKLKKRGYYYFASAQAIILVTLVVLLKSFDWINIGVAVMILVILGFSSRKMD
ncbi:MAG: hypothetical protein K9H16_12695 [Bacteroidales bacterium]|nr:hypothetical protein [Bacteroidales bacterium]